MFKPHQFSGGVLEICTTLDVMTRLHFTTPLEWPELAAEKAAPAARYREQSANSNSSPFFDPARAEREQRRCEQCWQFVPKDRGCCTKNRIALHNRICRWFVVGSSVSLCACCTRFEG